MVTLVAQGRSSAQIRIPDDCAQLPWSLAAVIKTVGLKSLWPKETYFLRLRMKAATPYNTAPHAKPVSKHWLTTLQPQLRMQQLEAYCNS